jgi:hypothetical protein
MKAVKFLWILSLFGYLAVALFVYADAREPLSLLGGNMGKQAFFYYSLAGMVLANALVLLLANGARYLRMPFRRRWNSDASTLRLFRQNQKEWFRGFALLANVLLMCLQVTVYNLNSNNNFHVATFAYLAVACMVVWLFAYVPIFNRTPEY